MDFCNANDSRAGSLRRIIDYFWHIAASSCDRFLCSASGSRPPRHSRSAFCGKTVRRIKSDWPNQIRRYHAQNECDIHDVKEREDNHRIRKKTPPENELGVPGEVKNWIRSPAIYMSLPDAQELLGTVTCQTMSSASDREEACQGAKE